MHEPMNKSHKQCRSTDTKMHEKVTQEWKSDIRQKRGSLYPQLEGPEQSDGVGIPNSRGLNKAKGSVSATQGAAKKRRSPYPEV